MDKDTRIEIRMPTTIRNELKNYCIEHNTTVSKFLLDYIYTTLNQIVSTPTSKNVDPADKHIDPPHPPVDPKPVKMIEEPKSMKLSREEQERNRQRLSAMISKRR